MRLLKLVLTVSLVCLIAVACSGDSEDSAPPVAATEPPVAATEPPVVQPTESVPTPALEPTDPADGLTTVQQEIAGAIFTAMLEDAERPATVTPDQIRCLGDGVAGIFSDDRIAQLGLNGAQLTAAYVDRSSFALGDDYDITDNEATQVVDKALECMDWRTVTVEAIASEGVPADQASCIVSEISDEGIRASVTSVLIAESGDDFGIAESEAMEALQSCVDIRETLYQMLVQEGLSEQSARCVADGLPEEVVDMMLGGQEPEEGEAALEMMGELMALQNRCLTPEELDLMGGFGG